MIFPVYGENSPEKMYGFSFGQQYGFVQGQALELVYPYLTLGEFLSELRYDMKPVFYYGITLDFGLKDPAKTFGLFSSASLKIGIPGDSGIHENRDWRSTINADLTDFSRHTNKTREFYWFDIAAGVSIPAANLFYIKPFISGSWMRFAFTGRDGYGLYARSNGVHFHPIDDNPIFIPFSGDVINYEQNWLIIAAGLTAGAKINPFTINVSSQISPFAYCAAIDEHIHRNIVWRDFTGWLFFLGNSAGIALFMESGASLSFTINPIELSLDFSYRHIGNTKGIVFENLNDTGFRLTDSLAGAGLSLKSFRFLVKINVGL